MVVYAVREPYALHVGHKVLPILGRLVALIVGIHCLQHLANDEVVASVLVEQDVASLQGSLLEVIHEFLLVEGQFVKSLHLVTKHLDIGK